MITKHSSSSWFITIVAGGLFLWGCSDTQKPTAADTSGIQEKLPASGGNELRSASPDTLYTNAMMGSMMGEMHGMTSRDSLQAGGMMTGILADTMHTVMMREHHGSAHSDSLMQKHTGATISDTSHAGGMMGMMGGGHHGGSMTPGKSGEGETQKENLPGTQPTPPDAPTQKDAHGH